jgi:hypothetical protein
MKYFQSWFDNEICAQFVIPLVSVFTHGGCAFKTCMMHIY